MSSDAGEYHGPLWRITDDYMQSPDVHIDLLGDDGAVVRSLSIPRWMAVAFFTSTNDWLRGPRMEVEPDDR